MVGSGTELVEMSAIGNGYVTMSDTQELVRNNDSMNSFISDSNEVTITRWIDHRKFSMMSFKPTEKNVVDIVVTTGQCQEGKQTLLLKEIGSQDIRSKYSTKARAAFGFVLMMLLVMMFLIVVAMIIQPWNRYHGNNSLHGSVEHSTGILHDIMNTTVEYNATEIATGNFTYT